MKQTILTGINEIDKSLNGINQGELILIAGRPASGKTALALTTIFNTLEDTNKKCLLFSLEMGETQITNRFDAFFMNTKPQLDEDYLPCSGIVNWLFEEKLIIDDNYSYSVLDISNIIKNKVESSKIDFVVIDYLQLMSDSKKHNSHQEELMEIVKHLKETAKETNTPIIVLSQIPRINKPFTPDNIFRSQEIASNIDKFIILQENNNDELLTNTNIVPITTHIYNSKESYTTTKIGFNKNTLRFTNL